MRGVKQGHVYRHFKGNTYVLLHVAIDASNARSGGLVAIYMSRDERGQVFSRDLDEWLEPVAWPDGVVRPRFILEGAQ